MKNFDDPDAFDEALKITEEHIGDPPMSLEDALDEIEAMKDLYRGACERIEELEKEIQGWKKLVLEMGGQQTTTPD